MDRKPTPGPVPAEGERLTEQICPACRKGGLVYVIPFRWGGERHLNWCCRSCGHAWAMAERRVDDRP